jgi:hypothetical protein
MSFLKCLHTVLIQDLTVVDQIMIQMGPKWITLSVVGISTFSQAQIKCIFDSMSVIFF